MLSFTSCISVMICREAGPTTEHTHLLQLNAINTSALTVLQTFNIVCKPSTEADNNIRSSAYIIAPTKRELMTQPLLHAFRLIITMLIKNIKQRRGERAPLTHAAMYIKGSRAGEFPSHYHSQLPVPI